MSILLLLIVFLLGLAILAILVKKLNNRKKDQKPNKDTTQSKTKKIKAFFIAPLLIPLSLAIILLMFGGEGTSMFPIEQSAGLVFFIGIPITYLSVLILGIPVYIILEDTKNLSYTSLFISGALASLIASFAIATEGRFSFKGLQSAPDNIVLIVAVITVICGVTAILFGRIAKGV